MPQYFKPTEVMTAFEPGLGDDEVRVVQLQHPIFLACQGGAWLFTAFHQSRQLLIDTRNETLCFADGGVLSHRDAAQLDDHTLELDAA
jgi:hypothetical protein